MLNKEQLDSTLQMLSLSIAQIEASMIEANESVQTLTSSFTKVAERFHHLDGHCYKTVVEVEPEEFANLRSHLNDAISSIQFYDRLTQRLHHVNESLASVKSLLDDPSNTDQSLWSTLQSAIKANYTMDSERILFESILKGESLDDALKKFQTSLKDKKAQPEANDSEADIELF